MAKDHGESSKQASKRAKKDAVAVAAALRDENDDYTNHDYTDTNSEQEAQPSSIAKKKKRPRPKVQWVPLMDGKKLEVEFNEYGQAVGKNSNKMSSYIGRLVRKMVPITCGSWHDVEDGIKARLWSALQQHFAIEECHRKWVLMSMGKTWRTYKSELSRKIRKLATSKDVKDNIAAVKELKPIEIKSDKEWENFVKDRCSQEFKSWSLHFQRLRGKQQKIHRTSRKGMARLRQEMIQENPQKPINRVDVWIRAYSKKDGSASSEEVTQSLERIEEYRRTQSGDASHCNADAINHVYGPERPGRVIAGGFGVTPSRMAVDFVSNSRYSKLEKKLTQLQSQYDELKSFGLVLHNQLNRQSNASVDDRIEVMQGSANTPAQDSPQVNKITDGGCGCNNLESVRCQIIDWTGPGDIAGEGKLVSTNPQSQVHHVILGSDCWKVWVTVALKNIPLYRPTSAFHMLNDAVGSTIAWPKKYILLE